MKVLINSNYIDLSLVKSITELEKQIDKTLVGGKLGIRLKDENGILVTSVIDGLNQVEYYEKFTITWITNTPQEVVYISNPSFYDYLLEDLKVSNTEEIIRNCWNINFIQAVEKHNKEIKEKHNQLLELWAKASPSDIFKIIF